MYNTASTPGFASPLKRGFIEPSPPVIKIPFVSLSSFWPHPAPVPDKPLQHEQQNNLEYP